MLNFSKTIPVLFALAVLELAFSTTVFAQLTLSPSGGRELGTLVDWLLYKFVGPDDTHFRDGLAKLEAGDLNGAETAFKESLQAESNQLNALLGLADVMNRKGQTYEAISYLKKALALAPKNAAVHRAWGRYFYSQKNFREAETSLTKAISLDPKTIYPRLDLGELYLTGLGNPQKAIETYRGALALDPKAVEAQYALGNALAAVGETEQALAELAEAARLAPKNPMPYLAIGRLHAAQKRYDKALEAYATALARQPNFTLAFMDRGSLFVAAGQDDKAIAEYEAVLRHKPNSAEALLQIGVIHERHARVEAAEPAYLAAIKFDPKLAVAYNKLARLAAGKKAKLDDALVWSQKAVDLAPQVLEFRGTLGWVHYVRGEYDQTIAVLEKALAAEPFAQPSQARIFYHLGIAYAAIGKIKDSETALQKALALDPNFKDADDARQRLAR